MNEMNSCFLFLIALTLFSEPHWKNADAFLAGFTIIVYSLTPPMSVDVTKEFVRDKKSYCSKTHHVFFITIRMFVNVIVLL